MVGCLRILFIWMIRVAEMKTGKRNFETKRFCSGSALILSVVLTSLLAVLGVMFLMVARIDKMPDIHLSDFRPGIARISTVWTQLYDLLIDGLCLRAFLHPAAPQRNIIKRCRHCRMAGEVRYHLVKSCEGFAVFTSLEKQ